MTYKEDLARCRKIFSAGQISSDIQIPTNNKVIISDRMTELYNLLKSYNIKNYGIEENIHWVAILGGVGRLFESLKFKIGSSARPVDSILTKDFKSSARRAIYHSRGPFSSHSEPEYVIKFFMHCYEHCRIELFKLGIEANILPHKINISDREKSWFITVINMGSIWVDQAVKDSEIKSKAQARLVSNKESFIENLGYLKNNKQIFKHISGSDHLLISNIIIGNYIGTQVAWISCDASSLINGYASDSDSLTGKCCLTAQEKNMICEKYGEYVEIGKSYRHENICFNELLAMYGLSRSHVSVLIEEELTQLIFSPATKFDETTDNSTETDIKLSDENQLPKLQSIYRKSTR